MIGMIKKDLYMIRNNYKALGVALVIYLFYSITFNMDMSFFLPFMGLMICISTINYDEYNNWHTYAASLPQGRINIIKSKYITRTMLSSEDDEILSVAKEFGSEVIKRPDEFIIPKRIIYPKSFLVLLIMKHFL